MQIILLESIPHVGQLGDVVKVKDGFARNYLIPTKKAKRATAAAIEEFKAHKAELERAQAERLAKAEELKGKIDGLTITIASKAGVDGRLFGSVTNMDVAEAPRKTWLRYPQEPGSYTAGCYQSRRRVPAADRPAPRHRC